MSEISEQQFEELKKKIVDLETRMTESTLANTALDKKRKESPVDETPQPPTPPVVEKPPTESEKRPDIIEGTASVTETGFRAIKPERDYLPLDLKKLETTGERVPTKLNESDLMVSTDYKAQFRAAYRSDKIEYLTVEVEDKNIATGVNVTKGDIQKNFPSDQQIDFLTGVNTNAGIRTDRGDRDPIPIEDLMTSNKAMISNEDFKSLVSKLVMTLEDSEELKNGKIIVIGINTDKSTSSPILLSKEGILLSVSGVKGQVMEKLEEKEINGHEGAFKVLQKPGFGFSSIEESLRKPIKVSEQGILEFRNSAKVAGVNTGLGGKRKTNKKKSKKGKRKSIKKRKSSKSKKH